jgi:hypothetical protein
MMSNLGTDRTKALQQCYANAKLDGKPRYLHLYRGVYWSNREPPTPGPTAGMYGGEYMVVFPTGHYETYDPKVGPPAEGKQRVDGT